MSGSFLRWRGAAATAWFFLLFFASAACAHDLNMTGLKIRLGERDVSVSVVAHLHDLKAGDPSAEIVRRLKLRLDGQAFSPSNAQLIRDKANGIVMWQAKQNTAATSVAVDAPIFPELEGHTTVVTVFKNRQVFDEVVLDANHRSATLGETAKQSQKSPVFARFVREGVAHIFGGFDHLLFLWSLLLLGGTAKCLLKIVTAFTFAHSVTLSLAATGIFSLPPRWVEPVIALSIVAVCAANFRAPEGNKGEPRTDFRPYLALSFGLIHGFGFAGALTEVGLPRENLAAALVAFNLGVELGQAMIVLLCAPILAAFVKLWPRFQLPLVRYGSATAAMMGTFWFVERLIAA